MAACPTCGQSGCVTPTILRVPNAQRGDKKQKWLRGPHVGKVATSPLPSWGSPTLSAGTKIRNGYVAHMWAKWLHHPYRLGGPQSSARGQKSEMATCPTCGKNGYITPTVLGVPNTQRGDKNQKWLRGPHVGKVATSPLPSSESPTLSAGTKIRNGYVADMWAKWLHHPYRLEGPQHSARGQKSEMAMWPTCGQNGYISPTGSGVPNTQHGDKNQKWLRVPMWAKWLHHRYSTPAVLGVPNAKHGAKIRNGYVAHMWAKWLHLPGRLGCPQRSARGQRSEMATCPTCGQSGYSTRAVLGLTNGQRGDKNQKWLRGPHVGKVCITLVVMSFLLRLRRLMSSFPLCHCTPAKNNFHRNWSHGRECFED